MFFLFPYESVCKFEKLIKFHLPAFIVYKNGELIKFHLQAFIVYKNVENHQYVTVSDVVLAFSDIRNLKFSSLAKHGGRHRAPLISKSLDPPLKILNQIFVTHLNINSFINKFELLADQVKGHVDILVVSEMKLDYSLPFGQFKIPGYESPLRISSYQFSGGIMVFIREDIPSKLLSFETHQLRGFI